MPQTDLKGKTVWIATNDRIQAEYIEHSLKNLGARVVMSDKVPYEPEYIPVVIGEMDYYRRKNNAKIDAFIIHSPHIEVPKWRDAAIELTKQLKAAGPVFVCDPRMDFCRDSVTIGRIQDAGAKYMNFQEMGNDRMAFEIADAVAQHDKPRRQI